jgi:3-oxoacyl-[acyl-carrier protein] reductase
MSDLRDQVALVTGSSRGIGAALAREFARHGAKVVVHGRDTAAMAAVRADIERAGGRAMQVAADITSFAEIEEMRGRVEAEFGPIDILVANAGGTPIKPGPLEEITEEGWRASVDANLTATFLTIKSVLPGMKERGSGVIITISSGAARRPHHRSPIAYAAAKAGIAPEMIRTEQNADLLPPAVEEQMIEQHPLRRLGTTEDVARAAVFLASADSSWITGIVVDIAGGAVMV